MKAATMFLRLARLLRVLALLTAFVIPQSAVADVASQAPSDDLTFGSSNGGYALAIKVKQDLTTETKPYILSIALLRRESSVEALKRIAFDQISYIVISNSANVPLPRIADHNYEPWSSIGGDELHLAPGQYTTETYDLSYLYDLKPGQYKIFVERPVFSLQGVTIGQPRASTTFVVK